MNQITSSATSRKLSTRDIVKQSSRRRTNVKEKKVISTNPFHVIMENQTTSPKEKAKHMQKLLVGEQAIENIELLEEYKVELQEQRKIDNKAVIDLTDNEVFSQMKDVIESMHKDVVDFGDQLAPFTEIVSALNTMRANGVTGGVLKEIIREKEEHDKRQLEISQIQETIKHLNYEIERLERHNIELGNDKILFFGPVKSSSKNQIGFNDRDIEANSARIEELNKKIEELNNFEPPNTKYEPYIEEKKKLRDLLDISSDKHKEKQTKLIGTAKRFVVNSDEKMKGVLGKFGDMTDQLDKLQKSNYHHGTVYSIIDQAQGAGLKENKKLLDSIRDSAPQTQEEIDNETSVDRRERQMKERKISNVFDSLHSSHTDTSRVSSELLKSQASIDQAIKSNSQQYEKAKRIQSSGIAGTANGLATVLQAVNRAAISETSEAAQIAIDEINKISMNTLQDEAISSAQENKEVSQTLRDAFDELANLDETFRAAAEINREAIEDINAGTEDLKYKIDEFKSTLQENASVAADASEI